jgi:hypothetical protein
VLPARFGTVFLSEASLEADIKRRKRALAADFKRVAGAEEWGVKVFAIAPSVTLPPISARSGRDYLKRKAAILQTRTKPAADPEVREFAAALKRLAVDSTGGGRISSGQQALEWQGSLLLPRKQKKKFTELVERYSRKWKNSHRIECTGPWPPYSFVSRAASAAGK